MTRSVAARFSRAARTYEGVAGIHGEVAARLLRMLARHPWPQANGGILEIGCGTGLLTRMVRKGYPEASICAVDLAERMVSEARQRLPSTGRLAYLVADGRNVAVRRPLGLVVSSAALHWIHPLESVFTNLHSLLAPEGILAAAIMVEGTLGELHRAREHVAAGKPVGQKMPTVRQVRGAFSKAGFVEREFFEEALTLTYESAAAFIQAIRAQGVTGGPLSTAGVPLHRSEIRALIREYDRSFSRPDGSVCASYRVMYVVAAK
jgi:malonyl-CoA O-methyltransferase